DHRASHAGNRRHDRRHRGHAFAANLFGDVAPVEQNFQRIGVAFEIDVDARSECDDRFAVARVDTSLEYGERDRAIHRAGVEVEEVQLPSEHSSQSRFTRSGWTVDGDDHTKAAKTSLDKRAP